MQYEVFEITNRPMSRKELQVEKRIISKHWKEVKDLHGQECIYVENTMTPKELGKWHKKQKRYCIETLKQHPKEQWPKLWEILTSRGEDRFIYGPLPKDL